MKKILVLADYGCGTGFAQVASNIFQHIAATGKYDITVIGINYDPSDDVNLSRWPGRIIPAVTVSDMNGNVDVYGRQKVLNELGKGIYDIFFTIQDTFIIQEIVKHINETRTKIAKKYSTIIYYPIDATPKNEWITECVSLFDFPVPYTNYAKAETIKIDSTLKDIQPIYHGTNLNDFNYVEDREYVAEFRRKYFEGKATGKFLLMNVNRNQPRKDIVRNFMILKELKKRGHDNVLLYLHMAHNDAGGNILVMADYFGFKLTQDYILPSPKIFQVNQGLPLTMLNLLYNCSDAVISTTLGEGWGLSITEAMATRTPVIAPDNTSLHEMMADNRGILVPSGADDNMWFNLGAADNERMRPLTDVNAAVDAIENIMQGKLPDIDGAYKWATEHSWDNICKEWIKIFDEATTHAEYLNEMARPNRAQRRKGHKK
jgi:glycosyltransferase involved in cell wall biosynthesis